LRIKLIACEILYRECCAAVARSPNRVDVEFLPKGLHDIGREGMNSRLAAALEAVDESQYDAIALGYGLCSHGIMGLRARRIPLVVARAHDCITLLLGSKERYQQYFETHPGVYYKSSGWIERGEGLVQLGPDSQADRLGTRLAYEELLSRYGEDNARYLAEQLGNLTRNYTGLTYIEMGVEPDGRFEAQARKEAAEKGWTFEKLRGGMALIRALVDGPWDEERFLVVRPGERIVPSYDEQIAIALSEADLNTTAQGSHASAPMNAKASRWAIWAVLHVPQFDACGNSAL